MTTVEAGRAPYHNGLKVVTFAAEAAERAKARETLKKLMKQHGIRPLLMMLSGICNDEDKRLTKRREYGLAHLYRRASNELTDVCLHGIWPV